MAARIRSRIVVPVVGVMGHKVMCGCLVVGVVLNGCEWAGPVAFIADGLVETLPINERAHRFISFSDISSQRE